MTLWCPVCREPWPAERSVCRDCLAQLVTDPDATVACRHCGEVWPARMHSCPNCLAELQADAEAVAGAAAAVLAAGLRLPRPAGTSAFARGPSCTLLRTAPRSSLLYTGGDELLEAYVDGRDHRAVAPLSCHDLDGALLFRLVVYEAAEDALVAVDAAGAPLATYLRVPGMVASGLAVRDETSAPAARLVRAEQPPWGWDLVETGGVGPLARVPVVDRRLGDFVDDEWTLRVERPLPLRPLAAVALLLAAKALLGRAAPSPVRERAADDEGGEEQGFELTL